MKVILGLAIFILSLTWAVSLRMLQTLGLPPGELCRFLGDREWRCKTLQECPQVSEMGTPMTICSQGPRGPVVCCPSPAKAPKPTPGQKARSYCDRTATSLCNNSVRGLQFRNMDIDLNPTIAGGKVSMAGEHPYMGLIGYGDNKDWLCGGTLISERFVVSAAHCATGGPKVVRFGDLDYSRDDEVSAPQEVAIAEIIVHPEFKDPAMYHDIALFRLEKDVNFTDFVRPACLNTLPTVPYKDVTAAGWGRTSFVDDISPVLRAADLSLVNQTVCNGLRKSSSRVPQGINSTIMICAGVEGIRDTCQGDSGGPIVVEIGQRCLKTQVGITSFGGICAQPNSPGVYTRISYYISWIENIIWP